MAAITTVPNIQDFINRMVRVKNHGGQIGRLFLSEEYFEGLKQSADTVKTGGGLIYLTWNKTPEMEKVHLEIKAIDGNGVLKKRYEILSIKEEVFSFKRERYSQMCTTFMCENERLFF